VLSTSLNKFQLITPTCENCLVDDEEKSRERGVDNCVEREEGL
jgi:hypothetical protein